MAALRNARHEAFAQALFQNKSATEAYQLAGFQPHDGNASRLRGNEQIKSRLAELQSEAAKASEITVASLLAELEDCRQRATSLDQIAAAVKAIQVKAAIAGISEQKITVTHTYIEKAFAEADTLEQIAERFAWLYEDRQIALTPEQQTEFGLLLRDVFNQINDFLAPLQAKTVPQLRAPTRSAVDYERKRLGLARR